MFYLAADDTRIFKLPNYVANACHYLKKFNFIMLKMSKILFLCFALFLLTAANTFAQPGTNPLPKIIEKNGRHAFLVDGKPFLMLGGQAHNSSAWPGMMPQVWTAVKLMHLNTLEVPIYWEQIEPQPGKFDFSVVDTLLKQARVHQVRLVLLWFGTWKNGSSHYMPAWMKREPNKYPNIIGAKGQPIDSPSPHIDATLQADIKAFTMVMGFLKKADPQHTVIMVQVENEPGSWDSVRDHSPLAEKLIAGQVPASLLKPEVLKALNTPVVAGGTWKEVFGNNADEYFHAWSIAHFIGQVAAAGKSVYPLPMYTNAALRDPLTNPKPTHYESGGPTDNVIPIWQAAAPALDLLAPDIYLPEHEKVMKVLELYNRWGNPLFVPEAALTAKNSKYLYPVIAGGGIGFSPFGIDDNGHGSKLDEIAEHLTPYGQEYAAMAPMMRELAQWAFDGKIQAVVEAEDHAEQTIDLGSWKATVSFGGDRGRQTIADAPALGRLMIVKLSENKFVIIGSRSHITFAPLGANAGKAWQYLKVEEGRYANGTFKPLRILNGDETDFGGPRLGSTTIVLQAELILR